MIFVGCGSIGECCMQTRPLADYCRDAKQWDQRSIRRFRGYGIQRMRTLSRNSFELSQVLHRLRRRSIKEWRWEREYRILISFPFENPENDPPPIRSLPIAAPQYEDDYGVQQKFDGYGSSSINWSLIFEVHYSWEWQWCSADTQGPDGKQESVRMRWVIG